MKNCFLGKVISLVVVLICLGAFVVISCTTEKKESATNEEGVVVENEKVVEINKILPARMFDGYSLASVSVDKNNVTLNLVEKTLDEDLLSASSDDLIKFGISVVSGLEEAYLHIVNGGSGEGEEDMFVKLNPIIKSVVEKNGSLTIKVKDNERKSIEVKLSYQDVKRGIDTDM